MDYCGVWGLTKAATGGGAEDFPVVVSTWPFR
jgi:hypothetical protein